MNSRVKDYRLKRGYSQASLAYQVGIARQTLSMIENGRYNPSLDLCIRLAEALDTDLNTLFWKVGKDVANNF